MERLTKSFELIKSSENAGTVSGYFSTYDRIADAYGDVVEKGAFTDTIKVREKSGHPFPLCWNHDLNQIIGKVEKIEDTENGPLMTASFFDSQLAQEKRNLVQNGVVYQFSFAYDVKERSEPSEEEKKKGITNILKKLDLFEVSIVPIPANPRAEVTDIKSGKRNSKKDADTLEEVIRLLRSLLDEAEIPEGGEEEPKANADAKELEELNQRKEKLLNTIKNIKNTKE